MAKGKYICIEGGDGTGKSTLVEEIYRRLSPGACRLGFPSGGDVGTLIRSGLMGKVDLDDKAYLYLFAADGLNEEETIQTLLRGGNHVICDRHPTLSGRVFQPKHHPIEHIESVYNSAADDGISMPDFLFVLDLDVKEARKRMDGREKYKDVVFEEDDLGQLHVLRQRYLHIADTFDGKIIDASKSTAAMAEEIIEIAGLA